ncbi:hypothetical protein GOZ78_12735 [Agrobacterium vitis]|uniref:BrnA antitoxin family protein n=1 Tax=Agrobacterium vitis TaxID=373 RepID=A0ABD6G6K3_AGRVI|nr:BrnA antitoxin family protein [Agrobacterium vitis]MUO80491.1 hypothetical protein [Agrobacterium vitis]MUO93890.1 hypothetical protein [Agrobacterium vitis]MUP03859.1 hypothetical protein [Agrobacterium vitis]MUZ83269.1 hypothetical protein [Agrobacterium vitis]MVA10891.1 hypothetical protein [Agrobacterium vitis]
MTAKEKSTKNAEKQRSHLPTLEDVDKGLISLDDYEIAHGEDVPELTEAGAMNALSVSDVPELKAMFERARGQRGQQKAPVKERIGLRLDHNVVEHFRKMGPGWQSRINDVLAGYVKADGK